MRHGTTVTPRIAPKSLLQRTIKDKFRLESKLFYETFFSTIRTTRDDLADRFREVPSDSDYVAVLEDDASTFNAFVEDASHLLLVAMYHWIERSLKLVLSHCDHGAQRAPRDVAHMNMEAVAKALGAYQVDLRAMPNFGVIEILRLHANSWKHDGKASNKLLQGLGVPLKPRPLRLSDSPLEKALRRSVGLKVSSDEEQLVLAFRERALQFLSAVADAAPIAFPTERRAATPSQSP